MQMHLEGPETARLRHRAFTVDDAAALYAINSHPEVMRYTGEEPFPSLEVTREAIASYPDFKERGFGRWACVDKASGAIIGMSGLKYLPEFDAVDVGYRFLPEWWGKGLATESGIACLEFGFSVLGLEEIIGLVLPDNSGSIRVLEKLGMKRDGSVDACGAQALRFVITAVDWQRGEA